MAVNLKIVSQVVASGTPGPAGKSAYQIAVDNGFEGTESEWLKELNPFKGWFDSVSELDEEHSAPSVGEYAYVKGATSSDPVKIYECSTEGSWSDSGRTVDTSTVQTFRSGEAVNDVGIDDEPTPGSDNLVKSGAVKNELALGAVYDVSAHNDGETFASLSALLSDEDLSTLIPTSVRKGGMSVKFVQSSDNKYVQYRLMAAAFSTTVSDWQGVDEEPIKNSKNNITSGAVYKDLAETGFVYNIQTTTFDKNYLIAVCISSQIDDGQINTKTQIEDYPCYNVSGYSDNRYYINVILEITNQKADVLYDDKKLRFLSEETVIDESDPSDSDYDFAGFTQCVIYKDKLYIFYRRAYNHSSEPGRDQYYWYYKVSSDKGKTWSERKSLSIESDRDSNWDGYRDNRGGYVTVYGDYIIMLGVISPSTSTENKPYRASYCLLSDADADGTLSIINWHLMPDISFGNSGQDAIVLNTILPDTERTFSNVVAGRLCIVDNILYWCVYGSANSNGYMDCALCKWPININSYPTSDSVEVLHKFDGKQDYRGYCESSIVYSRNKLAVSVLDVILAHEHNCNLNYLYDIESDNIEYVCTTEQRYAGVETFPIDNDIILQTGRASRYDYINRCDFIGLFTGGNICIKEYIPLIGKESYNSEGMYCGICANGDTIFISYYYIKSDNKHIVAFKTINKRDIIYLLNN